jgi:hypothetical protein
LSDYEKTTNPDAKNAQDFYMTLDKASRAAKSGENIAVSSPDGASWRLERSFSCGWKIWHLK